VSDCIDFGYCQATDRAQPQASAPVALSALRRHFPHVVEFDVPGGVRPVVVYLPTGLTGEDLLRFAGEEGVKFSAPRHGHGVVELYCCHLSAREVEEGLARLGRALASCLQEGEGYVEGGSIQFVGP